MTDVVAAIVRRGDRVLICQRGEGRERALLWEFPGGKVEPGETPQEALRREVMEELRVRAEIGPVFCSVLHEYPDLTIRLTAYEAEVPEGEPQRTEQKELRWVLPNEMGNYPFCPADGPIVQKLMDKADFPQ